MDAWYRVTLVLHRVHLAGVCILDPYGGKSCVNLQCLQSSRQRFLWRVQISLYDLRVSTSPKFQNKIVRAASTNQPSVFPLANQAFPITNTATCSRFYYSPMQLWTFSAVAMTVIAPLPGRNSSVGLRLWPIGGSVCTNLFGNVVGSTKRRRKKKPSISKACGGRPFRCGLANLCV